MGTHMHTHAKVPESAPVHPTPTVTRWRPFAVAPVDAASRARTSDEGRLALQRRLERTRHPHHNLLHHIAISPSGPRHLADRNLRQRLRAATGRGRPIGQDIRQRLEVGLGADLSNVRIHTDHEAHQLSRLMNAVAFTTGRDIFFQTGTYKPRTRTGLRLLAHEAAHTVQQTRGLVDGIPASGDVSVTHPDDRFERAADEAARQASDTPSRPAPETSNDARSIPASRPPTSGRSQNSSIVVQRKVGFEFEVSGGSWWKAFGPSGSFNEKTHLLDETNWHLSADIWFIPSDWEPIFKKLYGAENIKSSGELEFVTAAFEETNQGEAAMKTAVTEIQDWVKLTASTAKPNPEMDGKSKRLRNVFLYLHPDNPEARIQMTTGVKLDHVLKVLSALAGKEGGPNLLGSASSERQKELQTDLQEILAQAEKVADRSVPAWSTPAERREYAGAIAHLAAYVTWASSYTTGYTKSVIPFLSRTNLGELAPILRLGADFKKDVKALLPRRMGKVTGAEKLLPQYRNYQGTIDEWLDEISKGKEPIGWDQQDLPEWSPQAVGEEGKRRTGHVYEFRGLEKGISADKWLKFAEQHFAAMRLYNNVVYEPERKHGPSQPARLPRRDQIQKMQAALADLYPS